MLTNKKEVDTVVQRIIKKSVKKSGAKERLCKVVHEKRKTNVKRSKMKKKDKRE